MRFSWERSTQTGIEKKYAYVYMYTRIHKVYIYTRGGNEDEGVQTGSFYCKPRAWTSEAYLHTT